MTTNEITAAPTGDVAVDDADHTPVEKRLSGDFKGPVELLAAPGLDAAAKREILDVWLRDLKSQPETDEALTLRENIVQARASLDEAQP